VSRNAFDIEGLGEKNIKSFYDDGLIQSPPDIFTLAARDKRSSAKLAEREGWGTLSAEKLFAAIETRRTVRLDRFIYALGLRHVGETTARLLARNYGTIAAYLKATRSASIERAKPSPSSTISRHQPDIAVAIADFFADA
jgi:DNA ligase (NAD+)